MAETRLDVLCKQSVPALVHDELVALARTCGPSQAKRLAETAGWPHRQARAVKALATVRRDFSGKVFDDLLKTREQVRAAHAALGQLKGDAMSIIDALYPPGVRDVCFHLHGQENLMVHWLKPKETQTGFADEIKRLGLTEAEAPVLVKRVAEALINQWAQPDSPPMWVDVWGATIWAVRKYLPGDQELLRRLMLATVTYCGGRTKSEGTVIEAILPEFGGDTTLQDVINYILAQGVSEAELRAAWAEMLKRREAAGFLTSYIECWWYLEKDGNKSVLKIGDKSIEEEIRPVARTRFWYELTDILVNGCFDWPHVTDDNWVPTIGRLFNLGYSYEEWRNPANSYRQQTRELFVKCFARGAVGVAFHMLVRFGIGHELGLWSEYSGDKNKTIHNACMEMMREAIPVAEQERRFGIASALAEFVGDNDQADRLRHVARAAGQKVVLDFAFYASRERLSRSSSETSLVS